ncbi:MAG: hypothetical protein SGILL_009413 [Bacillariaceae sp.]
MKTFLFACAPLLCALLIVAPIPVIAQGGGLEDQDLSKRQSQEFEFTSGDNNTTIRGTIWLPPDHQDGASSEELRTLVALVHGDGPQDRTSGGGYNPLINALLDQGIHVASWDKAGIGDSDLPNDDYSWLDQSMSQRADETRSAIGKLRETFHDFAAVGALGFSQAGWVLPRLSTDDDLDFLILVGPAVNWQDQGEYFARKRMEAEGANPASIEETIVRDRVSDDMLFNASTFPSSAADDLTEERWAFIKRNRHEDATAYVQNLTIPTLAVWGEDDLNVNASHDAEIYRAFLGACPHKVVLIPNATHGLQRSESYNYQLADQWPLDRQVTWYEQGRFAYAAGAIELITDWILLDHYQKATCNQTDPGDDDDNSSQASAWGLWPTVLSGLYIVLMLMFG